VFVRDGRVIYSATDLIIAAQCEYQLLRELDFKLGRGEQVDPPPDEMLERAKDLGEAHEAKVLAGFIDEFGIWDGASHGVAQIARPERHAPEQLRVRQAETVAALEAGAQVVFQATFFDERFVGFADFLVRGQAGAYTVYDTKLARQARVSALLQLAAYADQLERLGFDPGREVALILGTMRESRHQVSDLLPVYRERRTRLERLIDEHQATERPVEWQGGAGACGRCPSCAEQLEATDDVLLVSGVRVPQRRKLRDAGIETVADLAEAPAQVAGIARATLDNLRQQARLQRGQVGDAIGGVRIEVHTPAALSVIPPPDAGDVFFDFEGDPLFQDADGSWGLEYLFGFVTHGDGGPRFEYFWADDRKSEGQALDGFVEFIEARRSEFPNMRVYHYANYEKNALLKLAASHGRHEDTVDDWLRVGLFVDLYPLVSNSMRSSAGSLGLKALEPLYMGDELRGDEVATGADSMVAFAEYSTLLAGGRDDDAQKLRTDILAYNEYDCVSTLRLRDWLIAQRDAAGIAGQAVVASLEDEGLEPTDDVGAEVVAALHARAAEVSAGDPVLGRAYALLASSIGYHQREAKPHWWAHFDRLSAPPDQWMASPEVVLADSVRVIDEWEKPTARSNARRELALIGALPEGSPLSVGRDIGLLYDVPPECVDVSNTGHRGWTNRAKITGITEVDGRYEIRFHERTSREGCQHDELPMALIPGQPISTKTLTESIRAFGEKVAACDVDSLPQHPTLDLLQRRPPRLRGGDALPSVGDGPDAYIAAIGRTVKQLDNSYLAVQGPPGTGKTFVGARVIAHLVSAGWKIGVTAQSHEVVENLLREVITAGCPADHVAKKAPSRTGKPSGSDTQVPWRTVPGPQLGDFLNEFDGLGAVVGGTAWDMVRFADSELDLLVIDEAGQFTLANTVAVARPARRLLLLGDPQQLPQVTQGTHSEPVAESALGWLLGDHDTLPGEYGYFLGESWRMHSAVCAAVSRHSYEARLHAKSLTDSRELSGIAPGIHTVFVEHWGNATSSPEEAHEVVRQIEYALEQTWRDEPTDLEPNPVARPMTERDVLVVAAYNAQVSLLRQHLDAAGYTDVKIGTVDKLQGQQAPFVVVSMAASAIDDVPRGMDFLLSRNRINVAVSRAKWCTVIVRSPALTDFLPATITGLGALGAFIGLGSAAD